MKPLVALGCLLVAALTGVVVVMWFGGDAAVRPQAGPSSRAELDELRERIAALTKRLEAMEVARPAAAGAERNNAFALDPRTPSAAAPDRRDPYWYLEQYVLSFADDTQGSEYFRLAVDAYVVELVTPIAALVRDSVRPVTLRIALVTMLGKRRFDEVADVIDALLAAVGPPAPEALALRALEALARIGSARFLPGLEAVVALVRDQDVRERAVALLVELGGDGANAALLRLFLRAGDDAMRRLLVRHLNGADALAALDLLRAASGGEQPVRLDAARKTGEYDEPDFDAFVAQWRQVETDAQVIAALGGPGAAAAVPSWSAKKAIGPPDAQSERDDPNAWASKHADMGLQWLQLTYASPMQANGVRIFECDARGAVAEVLARTPQGEWTTLWRGTANVPTGPLVLSFPLTAFAVRTIRIVLDTDRTKGWNEIDAVELLGPGGGQWASRASASSTYASGSGGSEQAQVELLEYRAATRKLGR